MKKLLSLLSVLTISGSAIPTTIAASPYQIEKNNNNLKEKMESDFDQNKLEAERINIYYHLPGYLYFQGNSNIGPVGGNPPDWSTIKQELSDDSDLPIDIINQLSYSNLIKQSVTVFIPNGEYYNYNDGNYYYGARTIYFHYN